MVESYTISDKGKILNSLGREYVESITSDQFNKAGKFDLRKRTAHQIEIANEVVVRSESFVYVVAKEMLHGRGWKMGGNGRVSLKGFNVGMKELVPEGIICVLENLHNYNPEKSGMTTFIGYQVASRMYDMGMKYTDIPLSRNDFVRARSAVKRAIENGDNLQEALFSNFIFERGERMDRGALGALALGTNMASARNINGPAFLDNPYGDSWESVYLGDNACGPEKCVEELDIVEKVRGVICSCNLSERDVDIIESHGRGITFKKLSEKYGIGIEGIRMAEKRARKKLRKPLEALVV